MKRSNKRGSKSLYCRRIKRVLDIFCSLAAMIVFCWLYAIVAILVRTKLGKPVIFKQKRPGRIDPETGKEQIFTLYKFRTMTDERDKSGEIMPDKVRLTKFGKFIRSTSLDELPEAWNILKGDMSVVGPRPLAIQYLPFYTVEERTRHLLRPGLTGLAQVNGRNATTWEDRFAFDAQYEREASLGLDINIIIKTVFMVFKRSNIGTRGVDTPLDFDVYRKQQMQEVIK